MVQFKLMWSFHRLEFRGPQLTYVPGTHKLLADPKTTGGYVLFFETSSYLLVGFHLCFPPGYQSGPGARMWANGCWCLSSSCSNILANLSQIQWCKKRILNSNLIALKPISWISSQNTFIASFTPVLRVRSGKNITFKLQSKFIKRISLPDLLRTKLLKTISSLSFARGILTCSGKPSSI